MQITLRKRKNNKRFKRGEEIFNIILKTRKGHLPMGSINPTNGVFIIDIQKLLYSLKKGAIFTKEFMRNMNIINNFNYKKSLKIKY